MHLCTLSYNRTVNHYLFFFGLMFKNRSLFIESKLHRSQILCLCAKKADLDSHPEFILCVLISKSFLVAAG